MAVVHAVLVEEAGVAAVPGTGGQVRAQPCHGRLRHRRRREREGRTGPPQDRVEEDPGRRR
ncbi:hypothetical protein GCM10023082_32750 [Streptomyces tremellae]|uniref:Uncharacterized protein n=1 Tax=Streptomyces tremellae TaxID=1124239 RepID=A0ABP7F947_9ACTN